MPHTRSVLTMLVASLMLAPTAVLAVDAGPSPTTPAAEAGASGQGHREDPFAESIAAEPDSSIVDAMPVPWDRLEIGPDGRDLRVYFFGGAPECNGLARVEIDRDGDVPTVMLWMGLRPDAAERACLAIALPYHVDIDLEEPLVRDGAPSGGLTDTDAVPDAISVREALAAPDGESVIVRGSLLAEPEGSFRLWEALLESYPPQGGAPSLALQGLDAGSIDLEEAAGVRWSSDVTLRGTISDGSLVVDEVVASR
jgi:hypothetical protein